jgi:hypothetical protein
MDIIEHFTLLGLMKEQDQITALVKAPIAVKWICAFCYSDAELDLPSGKLPQQKPKNFRPYGVPRADILATEAAALSRIFFNDKVGRARKQKIWLEILSRATEQEESLLEGIRLHRTLPISKDVWLKSLEDERS